MSSFDIADDLLIVSAHAHIAEGARRWTGGLSRFHAPVVAAMVFPLRSLILLIPILESTFAIDYHGVLMWILLRRCGTSVRG